MPTATQLPPIPDLGELLKIPLPDLVRLSPTDTAWQFGREFRETHLLRSEDRGSIRWLLDSAILARDLARFDESLEFCNEAYRFAFRSQDSAGLRDSVAIRITTLVLKGDFSAANQLAEQISLMSETEDASLAIYEESLGNLRQRTVVQDLFVEARDYFQSAHERYERIGDAAGSIRCLLGVASAMSGCGAYFRTLEIADQALRKSVATEHYASVGRILLEAALALRDQGYRHNVEALFLLAIRWCAFLGDAPSRLRAIHGLAYLYDFEAEETKREDRDKSERLFFEAIEEAKSVGAFPLLVQMRLDLVRLYEKFKDGEAVEYQRALAKDDLGRMSASIAPYWLSTHDTYREYIEHHRLGRHLTKLREAIEAVGEPIFIFDPLFHTEEGESSELVNEFRNSTADALLGIGSTTVRTFSDIQHIPYIEGLREPLLSAVHHRLTYEDEIQIVGEGGQVTWFTRRVAPVGEGAVLALRNSTDSRTIQEALRIAAERARQADRAKSEFLANMSHEVRTPINGVLGLARLLSDSELYSEQRTYVDGIISSGDILLRVIGDVLDISKIEARSMEVEAKPHNIHRLVNEVVALHHGQAAAKRIELRAQIDPGVPKVAIIDGPRVQQILGNLVGNAVKFTYAGTVHVTLRVIGTQLELEVQDTGIGIPEDRLETIFAPFHQVDSASDSSGTGLGLTISKRLAELMGGDLTVTSRLGAGSQFSFRIPLVAASEAAEVPLPDDENVRFEGRRVLIVEDNPVNVLVARGLLTKLGVEVAVATNGREGVTRTENDRFDAVLMDIRMPILDGLRATRLIREREMTTGQHLPIIALTAGALTDEREDCFAAGVDDYLSKPFTLSGLRTTLGKWMGSPTAVSL